MATSDLDRVEELLADQEKAIRGQFLAFLSSVKSQQVFDRIVERLEARDIEGAMRIVDSYVIRMADVIPKASAEVGSFTATELAAIVAVGAPEIAVAISFDPSHQRAAEIVRSHRLRFITDFTREQRKATMQALNRSFNEGLGAIETARSFRDSIGLNSTQEAAVANYRRLLQNRDREALRRDLRDRRSDRTLERAIERDRPLTERQIDSMVDRYRRNYLQYRAENIARTEGVQATSEAREEATDQMMEQTGLARDRVIDIWNATRDTRTRDWHASMNGQERERGKPFTDGLNQTIRYPGDPRAPANTRINCRCTKTFRVKPAP
jgi:hypothetical protein